MDGFKKVVRVGHREGVNVFCKIEWTGGRLSISGVEGPMRNGNAHGAWGQIVDCVERCDELAPGWTGLISARFVDVWNRWHLNDMRAGCEHQREWPTTQKVEVTTYKLTSEALREQNTLKCQVDARLLSGESVTLKEEQRAFLNLPYTMTQAPDSEGAGSGRYEVKSREEKTLGWLRSSEHPEGLLCKPCPTCGYKYGSAWLREEVPADVLEFLRSLPDTDVTPAWV